MRSANKGSSHFVMFIYLVFWVCGCPLLTNLLWDASSGLALALIDAWGELDIYHDLLFASLKQRYIAALVVIYFQLTLPLMCVLCFLSMRVYFRANETLFDQILYRLEGEAVLVLAVVAFTLPYWIYIDFPMRSFYLGFSSSGWKGVWIAYSISGILASCLLGGWAYQGWRMFGGKLN